MPQFRSRADLCSLGMVLAVTVHASGTTARQLELNGDRSQLAVPMERTAKSAAVRVVESLSPGTVTITTADLEANIEVRARSTGSTSCAVEFTAPSGTIGVVAPPGEYSSWSTLATHIGKVTLKVDARVVCDSGALAEVRYFR